jgi:hypothetical protein
MLSVRLVEIGVQARRVCFIQLTNIPCTNPAPKSNGEIAHDFFEMTQTIYLLKSNL